MQFTKICYNLKKGLPKSKDVSGGLQLRENAKEDLLLNKKIRINLTKPAPKAIFVSAAFLAAFLLFGYTAAGRAEINRTRSKNQRLEEENSTLTDNLNEIEADYDKTRELLEDVGEDLENQSSLNENLENYLSDSRETIESQQEIIDEQQELIDEQQGIIDEQQEIIDSNNELLQQIADAFGVDINGCSSASLYEGLDKIDRVKELISNSDVINAEQYLDIISVQEEAIEDMLDYYPDFKPVEGVISYTYGKKANGSFHNGLDIYCGQESVPVKSAAAGTVIECHTVDNGGLGYYIKIDHGNGYKTLYGHLSKISVSVGQTVSKGQVIGMTGKSGSATGLHLHIEVFYNNARKNPIEFFDYS